MNVTSDQRPHLTRRPARPLALAVAGVTGLLLTLTPAGAQAAPAPVPRTALAAARLAPRTHFTMAPDGSSGLDQSGEGIPDIDSVKKTIASYYGDPGTGIASKTASPYISEVDRIIAREQQELLSRYLVARLHGEKPALVFDTDDTTLFTYDMEVGDMKFNFTPERQDYWVQHQLFPATPAMVAYVNRAAAIGYRIVGLTGRNDDQKKATLANLRKVGFTAFTARNFYTKWTGVGSSTQPAYITCATVKCTTVEYKAQTRKHVEHQGYTIVANYGDQWSDLQGGYADHVVKLPNPTYYLPSTNLPGVSEPRLAPRTYFTMAPDGSSGLDQSGEGIPDIDSVKKTIAVYYGDPGTGIASRTASPYISEVKAIVRQQRQLLVQRYALARLRGEKPALVFDTDDTTLFTYDMEVGDMKFNFTPARQDYWVQHELFPATPAMVAYVNEAAKIGYTVVGLTGRSDDQKKATLANLHKVGFTAFTARNFYTKWTGVGSSTQPGYITCATVKCTTVEYKAQTRKHVEHQGYTIVANYGDQWSDLQGGYADHVVKLPNPTYYLPSTNLPGVSEPRLAPRTHFTMAPDGSSGLDQSGEGIPNIDSVKKTIAVYYGDPGTGIASRTASPYISEVKAIVRQQRRLLVQRYALARLRGEKPALVFDTDDTTLFTYDMEVGDMKFNFTPERQDYWVQHELFPATPAMVAYVNEAAKIGYTVVGLTGRSDDQKKATLANLRKVGFTAFTARNFYTKWTGVGSSTQPGYITCAAVKCTTVEYKAQTRAHVEHQGYTIVANYGDQWSDLQGGYADHTVKLPNPTYYLP